jgi:glycosyltransferase involved in cell wall biosynthesis
VRILHLANLYTPVIGGLERSIATSSEELVRRGHEVTVLTLATSETALSARAAEQINGVRVIRVRSVANTLLPGMNQDPAKPFHPTAADPLTTADIRRVLRANEYDVVHSHDWLMYSYLPLHSGRTGLPHVHTAHDFGLTCVKKTYSRNGSACGGPRFDRCLPCASGQYGKPRAAVLTTALRTHRHRGIDALTAISPSVAEALRGGARIPGDLPIRVLSSLVPDGLDELARSTPRPPWLPTGPYLLFVGALGPHKGVDVLFAAYRRLVNGWRSATPPPELVCLGTARADTPPIPPGVRIRHDVPHAEVMAAWHGAAIGVVPSINEAMGQVAVEALLARTPLIASRTGGLTDMIRDGESGLHVPPGDAVALAAAIRRLLTDSDLAARLRTAGHQRGLDFTAARVVPQIEEVYRDCIASARG